MLTEGVLRTARSAEELFPFFFARSMAVFPLEVFCLGSAPSSNGGSAPDLPTWGNNRSSCNCTDSAHHEVPNNPLKRQDIDKRLMNKLWLDHPSMD